MDVNLDFIKTEPEDEGVKIETLDVQIKEELTPIQTELLSCVKTEINELPPTESSPKISTESTPLLCKQEPLDTFSDAGHHFMSSLIDQTNNETKPGCSFDIKLPDDGFDVPGPGQCYAAPLETNYHNPSLYTTSIVNNFICELCQQSFKTNRLREIHILAHHKDRLHELQEPITSPIFSCAKCPYQSIREKIYNNHILRHEPINKLKKKKKLQRNKHAYYCVLCSKRFITRIALDSHLIRKHNNYDMIQSEVLYCYHCSYQTLCKTQYRLHLERHAKNPDAENFVCGLCSYKTCTIAMLTRHKHEVHGGDERLICSFCKKKFNYSMALDIHLLRTHKDETKDITVHLKNPTFYCDTCPYMTLSLFSFKKHENTHKDNERSNKFTCETCLFQTFSRQQMTIHNRDSNCDSYLKCSACSYSTPFDSRMLEHKKLHVT